MIPHDLAISRCQTQRSKVRFIGWGTEGVVVLCASIYTQNLLYITIVYVYLELPIMYI